MPPFIDEFLNKLSKQTPHAGSKNFYKHDPTTLQNLCCYLREMHALRPTVLLVGEAPGYSGCARTGIAFTTGKELQHSHCNNQLLTQAHDYKRTIAFTNKEQSALCLYESLNHLALKKQQSNMTFTPPLLWNIYAFHPYKKYRPKTNRKPSQKEIDSTFWSLNALIKGFNITTIIAVGATASYQLRRRAMPHLQVRHPAYGGCSTFRKQMSKFYGVESPSS